MKVINTFTDTALLKLSGLKYFALTESNVPVMCTGDEVFEYMRRVIAESRCTGKSLELDLRIGGLQNGHPRLYSVAVELLRRLAAISESDFGAASRRQKYEVYLVNPYRNRANRQWSSTYMRHELRPLMERVKDASITSCKCLNDWEKRRWLRQVRRAYSQLEFGALQRRYVLVHGR
ncbi:hypothetical protein GN244_ATG08935 [Phytophthora infestans]|uniref:Uncharacterized protein n=1 Tax=Phytophthora infestans TaxID=4787 RepID=A0A833S2N6_PHYIN|nr:hypothetical protein GN244_ATG08935 [Phytophthora infestans]